MSKINLVAVKTLIFIIITNFLFFAGWSLAEEHCDAKYVLGPGDKIEISVWNHPELTRTMNVRPDGWVTVPLAGEFLALGVNPQVLASNIREKLIKYINSPEVSVIVLDYRSKKILVLGEVKTPGLLQYEGEMDVLEAIGASGGCNKHAELKSILVVRNAYKQKPEFYLVNLYKLIHDGKAVENVLLQPKDIVYVPKNFIGNLSDFMDFFASRVKPAADAYFFYEATKD